MQIAPRIVHRFTRSDPEFPARGEELPEHALIRAVIMRTVLDSLGRASCVSEENYLSAREWLLDTDTTGTFSLNWCAEALGRDPLEMSKSLQEQRENLMRDFASPSQRRAFFASVRALTDEESATKYWVSQRKNRKQAQRRSKGR